ncbi:MAG: SDR family NAD(P)-dependent oxidoreductase [Actinomycetota bacterium]|nr:SDR family NAD(P)-dependent oxidoreductase [Actinomycetota bacterium]
MSLQGKLAVVTGASSGIGRATAELLRDEGMRVIGVDINEEKLKKISGIEHLVTDLSNDEGRNKVVKVGNGAHALVNAAGLIRLKKIEDFTTTDIREIYAVNVEAPWFLMSNLGRVMKDGGSIVNLSSVSARLTVTQETAIYASSKTALLAMTRSWAHAYAPRNINVNAILPGITDTPMQDLVLRKLSELRNIPYETLSTSRLESVPMKRAASPREIAGFIRFLISDEGKYITGQSLSQDGGAVM